ncbi:NTP transferase domain-containing protein [Caulobacter sp. S45]|uniref:phosphocholine cytidylyltransferase family protein n=1 Tax=Caulobacter sp. S45 TaxID=1641861 RepID=UPI001C2DE370|nr:phosphocholine cytidylyltransferase family protein [Caulobacter sp. S45]
MILAAGVGGRLGAGHEAPKALLDFAGRTLLDRHVRNLEAIGVRDIAITVGHEAQMIRDAVAGLTTDARITFVENPRYRRGSLVSLWAQRVRLQAGAGVILMDADVLCDARMLARLGDGQAENTLLVDRQLEPGDEPMKLCFRRGVDGQDRIVDFRKRPEHAHDWHGESVGFFRFSGAMAVELAARCGGYVSTDQLDVEYEEAIRDLLLAHPDRFGAVDVSDLPWTEIDFEEDVVRARTHVLPQLIET